LDFVAPPVNLRSPISRGGFIPVVSDLAPVYPITQPLYVSNRPEVKEGKSAVPEVYHPFHTAAIRIVHEHAMKHKSFVPVYAGPAGAQYALRKLSQEAVARIAVRPSKYAGCAVSFGERCMMMLAPEGDFGTVIIPRSSLSSIGFVAHEFNNGVVVAVPFAEPMRNTFSPDLPPTEAQAARTPAQPAGTLVRCSEKPTGYGPKRRYVPLKERIATTRGRIAEKLKGRKFDPYKK
jgi:hypothetical protein